MGFNRPDLLNSQLKTLLELDCKVYLSLDVPNPNDFNNIPLSDACLEVAKVYSRDLEDLQILSIHKGCFHGVTEAITWGFSYETSLIILEDDVKVCKSFLDYATRLLNEFGQNMKIGSISGSNFVPKEFMSNANHDVRLSAYTNSWGWATWQDRWQDYLQDLKDFPNFTFDFPVDFWDAIKRQYWKIAFDSAVKGRVDAWDYRWLYSNWKRKRYTIVPSANLAVNLGFGNLATHTKQSSLPAWLPRSIDENYSLSVNLPEVILDSNADCWVEKNHFNISAAAIFKARLINSINQLKNKFKFFLSFNEGSDKR